MKKLIYLLFAICASASVATAGFLTVMDGFEAVNAGDAPAAARGWSSTGVTVSNANAYAGSNAAYFTTDAAATNAINETSSPAKAWSDFRIRPALGASPVTPPTNSASAIFFFDTNGYINVWNATDWTVCSNDVWGASVTAVSNAYVWISVYQNFTNHEAAIFLNDRLIIQDLPFPKTDLDAYNSFVVQNVDSNALLDNVWINASYNSGHTNDANSRAGVDVVEVDTYGYAGRTLYVNGSGTPNYTTIAAAVAAARNNDEINVGAGNYSTEAVAVSSSSELTNLVFVGNCFTVNTFTVNSGVTVEFNTCIQAATITANDNITLVGGADLTATVKLDVKNGATITGTSGSEMTVADLDMASDTTIDVAAGTFEETGAGFSLDGTFTVDGSDWHSWDTGSGGAIAQSLPFSENFDTYATNSSISGFGVYGWDASSADVKVQGTVAHSGRALILPDGTAASNKIDSATGAIWTEYYLRPMLGAQPTSSNTTGKSFMSYADTNGFMVVYSGGWITCSNTLCASDTYATNELFTGRSPTSLTTNNFKRIAIYQDFTTHEFALFIDNAAGQLELVAQKKAFPGTQDALNYFVINNENNNAYIDDISISTTAPTGSADLDGDGKPDVEEIYLSGSAYIFPGGKRTVFRFI